MRRALALSLLAALGCTTGSGSPPPEKSGPPTLQSLPAEMRLAYLREATVWSPIDTASLDLRRGPDGGRWPPGAVLECDFVLPDERPSGMTAKFFCRTADGETRKIKYGRKALEVYGELIGSRLLWALGFRSDRFDAVIVRCRGCPEDPWGFMRRIVLWKRAKLPPQDEVRDFEPAVIESYYGPPLESKPEQGIDWEELLAELSADPKKAREQRIHREALALFSGFIQHADSKPSQQTLSCAPGAIERSADGVETCRSPVIYIGDIGAILGDGWRVPRSTTTKIDYARWKATPVWRDPEACVMAVNGRPNSTLEDLPISEPARRFLADRLSRLSRAQLRVLFQAARVELLEEELETPGAPERTVSADDWAGLFLEKASRIIDHRCPL
jgi:hypothetical protein